MRRWALLVAMVGVGCWVASAHGATLTVTTTANAGAGSLRDAITQSNAGADADTITFDAGLSGKTIKPATSLPPLTGGSLTIQGDSKKAGTPQVFLDGSTCGGNGIDVRSAGNTIRGLAIGNFATAVSISGTTATGNSVLGCRLGTDLAGSQARPNQNGVRISGGASSNTIGGTNAARRNLVSGNSSVGVLVEGGSRNGVTGNYIGLDAAGSAAIANGTGVRVTGGATATGIGGSSANAGNYISGSTGIGVDITGAQTRNTRLLNNQIGANASKEGKLPNAGVGISVSGGAGTVVIGAMGQGNLVAVPGMGTCIEITSPQARDSRIEDNSCMTHPQVSKNQANYGIRIHPGGNAQFTGPITSNFFFVCQQSLMLEGAGVKPVVTENEFKWCRDGVTILNGAQPDLGNLGDALTTNDGKNKFDSTMVLFIDNGPPQQIKAEGNDWGSTSKATIGAKMKGAVDFDPLSGGASPGP